MDETQLVAGNNYNHDNDNVILMNLWIMMMMMMIVMIIMINNNIDDDDSDYDLYFSSIYDIFIRHVYLHIFLIEGYYSTYGKVGARTEMPGCSLCMGNQARVADKSTVVSTSTRNFPNRLGEKVIMTF